MLKKLVSGAVFNIANILVQVVLGLFVFREMLHYFGDHDFGAWSLIMAILAHIVLFEFGLGTIISRAISIKDIEIDRKSLISTSFCMIISIAIVFTFFVLFCWFLYNFQGDNFAFNDGSYLSVVIALIAGNFAMNFVSGAFQSYLVGQFLVATVNVIRFISNVARSILILLFIYLDLGIFSIAFSFFFIALFELLCRIWFSYKAGLNEDFSMKCFSKEAFDYLKVRAGRFIFLRVNDYTRNNSTILLTGAILGTASVVPLRISGRLMEIYVEISSSVNYLLTPYFSRFINDEAEEFRKKFKISIVVATSLSLFIFFNMYLHAEWFLTLWLGEFSSLTLMSLQVMAIGFCIANMQGPCTAMLIAKDEYKSISYLTICEIVLTLTLIPIFISYYDAIGAAYGLSMSLIIVRGIIQPIIISKKMSIPIFNYLMLLFIPAALVAGGFYGVDSLSKIFHEFSGFSYMFNFILIESLTVLLVSVMIFRRVSQ